MRIGTPLSKNATKVMLLGSGELGKEVIISLQRYGVEVIAVDRYENAPGHQVAHRAYVIDMANEDELRNLILEVKPHIIVPEIEAIATNVLLEIEKDGLAEVIPTARAAKLTMNREGIRILASQELGLPTSRYAFATSEEEVHCVIKDDLNYPCFIKPVMSSSGKGQSLIRHFDDIKMAWAKASQGGRVAGNKVIVEEKIEFDYEITLLTVRAFGRSGEIETCFCEPIGHRQIQGDYVESWQPQDMTACTLEKARRMAKKMTDNLGGRGIFGVEFFVKGDEVWFSEVSPRPHDTGMVTMISQSLSEFELHARAILGLPVSVDLRSPGASAVIYGGVDQAIIAFENVNKALSDVQCDIRLFGKPVAYKRRRMGVALAYSDSIEDARSRANNAVSAITIYHDQQA